MVVWSTLFRGAPALGARMGPKASSQAAVRLVFRRHSSEDHREFQITPSRFQWNKFKDGLHFYFFLGAIPLSILAFCVNIFIGPAQLTPIPEGYSPKEWEYSSHPISRFIARYIHHTHQQDYEKFLHHLYEESEKMKLDKLTNKVKLLMAERQDYQSQYFRPAVVKYYRMYREEGKTLRENMGDD